MSKKISDNEIQFIKDNFCDKGYAFCAKSLNKSPVTIFKYAKQFNLVTTDECKSKIRSASAAKWQNERPKPQEKRCVNANTFINGSNNKDIAYICGLLWGDGSFVKDLGRVSLNNCAIDSQDFLPIFLRTGNWASHTRKPNKRSIKPSLIISTVNKVLCNFLHDLGYSVGRKDARLAVEFFNKDIRHHWWRGYFDADGCFYFHKKSYSRGINISACYDYDWSFTDDLLKELSIEYRMVRRIRKLGRNSELNINGREKIKKFGKYLYKDSENCRLERKYQKWLECIS